MVTAYDVPYLSPLPGDAGALAQYGDRYAGVADAITAITRQLELLANDDITIGLAADALRTRTADAAAEIDVVLPRYRQSAIAIREFATALADAQQRANAVIAEHGPLHDELLRLYARRSQLEYDMQDAQYEPDPAAAIAPIARKLNAVQGDIADGEARLYTIWMAYLDADGDRTNAGNAAAARIVAGAAGSTDSILDHLASWWNDVSQLADTVAQWIGTVLYNALFYVAVLAFALQAAVVVLIAAIVIMTSPLGLILLAQLLPLIQSGQLSGMDLLEMLFLSILVSVAPTSLLLQVLLAHEANTPTPPMTPMPPYWGEEVDRTNKTTGEDYGNYEYAMMTNNRLDSTGLTDETIVEIVKITDDAGNVIGWRVTLPSTMDWQWWVERSEPLDHGAANDLASNLALILSPEQKAAYERMVLEAMRDAGIGPDDPVMLVGFSQGGILAGKLASQDDGFNIQAVVTAGAPIDAYDIPDDVSVISMQHANDPVPLMDGQPAQHGANWQTIEVPAPQDPANPSQQLPDHNGIAYEITALNQVDHPDPNDAALLAVIEDQSMFFSGNEVAYQYHGSEDVLV